MLSSAVPKETRVLAWIASRGLHYSFERLFLQDRTLWTKKKQLQDLFGLILFSKVLRLFIAVPPYGVLPETIRMLLRRGADPNATVTWEKKESVWCLFLSDFNNSGSEYMEWPRGPENWTQIIALLLDHGANTEVKCDTGKGLFAPERSEPGKILTVDQILERHFPPDSLVFEKLRERRSKRQALKRLLKRH